MKNNTPYWYINILFTKFHFSPLETTKTTWQAFRAGEQRWAFAWTDTLTAKNTKHFTNAGRVRPQGAKTTLKRDDTHRLTKACRSVAQEIHQEYRWQQRKPKLPSHNKPEWANSPLFRERKTSTTFLLCCKSLQEFSEDYFCIRSILHRQKFMYTIQHKFSLSMLYTCISIFTIKRCPE